jgi:hypothetical protein
MSSFSISPLTDHTGAEVTGLDFRTLIDADARTPSTTPSSNITCW